jgi:hypothetical protein
MMWGMSAGMKEMTGVMCHWPSIVLGDIYHLRGRGMPEPFGRLRLRMITEFNLLNILF